MDDRESTRYTTSHAAETSTSSIPAFDDALQQPAGQTNASFAGNSDLLQGTGSIPMVASSTGSGSGTSDADSPSFSTASAHAAPRYVRKRTPHRSQGTLDDLNNESEPSATYTHDSNISVGGATPLSGREYRRARSNISRVKSNSRYGQYLEIPKGRRSIFASRERARRRNSVLALVAVIILLVLAAMFIWNMMQNLLG